MQALALENESESDSESYTDEGTVKESYVPPLPSKEYMFPYGLIPPGKVSPTALSNNSVRQVFYSQTSLFASVK